MKKNFGAKTWLYPLPVLIIGTYDTDGVPNAMNVAWGGITDDCQITINLAKDRKTADNIKLKKCFTVFPATENNIVESDYFGLEHGYGIDKIAKAKFHASPAGNVDAPLIDEYPMALECEVVSISEENIDDGYRIIGRIVNVSADDSVLTDGKIDPAKLRPISYDPVNHAYLASGKSVGKAFSEGMVLKRRSPSQTAPPPHNVLMF